MNVFKKTKQKAWSNIGNRCKDYAEGCVVCSAYKFLELAGKFPDTAEILWEFMDNRRKEQQANEQNH